MKIRTVDQFDSKCKKNSSRNFSELFNFKIVEKFNKLQQRSIHLCRNILFKNLIYLKSVNLKNINQKVFFLADNMYL